tara:strand:- start:10014 stop:17351 length:7338 start_codon:yes stop_codon:yes gene_type:complete
MAANRKVTSILVYGGSGYLVASGDRVLVDSSNELFTHLGTVVQETRAIGMPGVMRFDIMRGSKWAWGNSLQSRMRLKVAYSDGTYGMFRVRSVEPDAEGLSNTVVEAWEIWADLGEMLLRYVRVPTPSVTYQYPISKITVDNLMNTIVFNTEYGMPSFFNLASVDTDFASAVVSVNYNRMKFLQLINATADHINMHTSVTMEMEAVYNNSSNEVDISFVRQVGLDASETGPFAPNPDLRPIRGAGKSGEIANRVRLGYSDAQDNMYTRIVPMAGPSEEELISVGGAWWDVSSYAAAVFTVEAGCVPFDDAYLRDPASGATFWVEVDNRAAALGDQTTYKITAMDATANTITVANHVSAFSTSAKLRIYSTIGSGVSGATVPGSFVTWIPDPVAEASKGVIEESLSFSGIPPYENMFEEAGGAGDMSGTWAAPTGGTVRGVTSLPEFMLVHAPDSGYKAIIRQLTVSTLTLKIKNNFEGIDSGDTFTMEDGFTWEGLYTVSGTPTYDAATGETTVVVESLHGGEVDLAYNAQAAEYGLEWNNNHITVAENTETLNIKHGVTSVKVTCDITGIGVRTENILLERTSENSYLSMWTSVRVENGGIKIQIIDSDGIAYPATDGASDQMEYSGNALYGLSIEGITLKNLSGIDLPEGSSKNFYVAIFAIEPDTVFYLDALSVTGSPTAWEYAQYMGKRPLFKAGAKELQRSGGLQKFQYDAEFYDITALSASASFKEAFVGSNVRILDMWDEDTSSYKVDVSTRIVEITETFDLIEGNYNKLARINTDKPSLEDRLVDTIPIAPTPIARPVSTSGAIAHTTVMAFQRAATKPSTPEFDDYFPPPGWFVTPPAQGSPTSNPLWMTNAIIRTSSGLTTSGWSEPVQLDSPVRYYIKPTDGTAIKNSSTATLTIAAHAVAGGVDAVLTAGSVQMFDPANTLVGTGYAATLDATDIHGSIVVTLKNGAGGTVFDTITLADITDGTTAYVEATGGLAWTQAINSGAWSPVATTTQLDFTFIQDGVTTCKDAKLITRDSSGDLTASDVVATGGNVSSATFGISGSGSSAITVTATFGGVTIGETVLTSRSGNDGAAGADGAGNAVRLTGDNLVVVYDQDGLNPSPSGNIALTATSQNFTNGFFKFTGDGITDETTYTDGTGANVDTKSWPIPSTIFSAPQNLRVGVAEGDQSELSFDTITIVAVQPGSDGTNGTNGDDAYTVSMSNESHTLPVNQVATIDYTGSGNTIRCFIGATELNSVTGTPTAGQFSVSVVDTNITIDATPDLTGNPIIYGVASAMNADQAGAEYTINLENLVTVTKVQSFAKSKEGSDGSNAKTNVVSASSLVFVKSEAGTLSPASIAIVANGQNLTLDGSWSTSAGTLTSIVNTYSGPSCAVTSANFVDGMIVTYTANVADGSIADSVTLKQLDEGSGNITAILSNEAHVFPASNAGVISSYVGSGTEIRVYEGATELTYDGVGTSADSWKVIIGNTSDITEGTASDSGTYATIGAHSAAANGTDVYVINYTISGQTRNGTAFTTFGKTQSLSKSKSGADGSGGSDAKVVKLTAGNYVISYDAAGSNPDPTTTITLTATSQNFTDPYFKFTGDGTPPETVFTDGTGDTDTFVFSVPASYFATPKELRVGVAEAAAATVEIAFDTITIAAVKVGVTGDPGADAYTVILTNEAHTLPVSNVPVVDYTGSGTTIVAYKGATELNGVVGTPTDGQFAITSIADTNITVNASPTTLGNPIIYGVASAMIADTADIAFTINLENLVSIVKTQTLAKSKEGGDGTPGDDAVLYYIKPTTGTAIQNGSGTLTIEAHKVTGGADAILAAGTIKLYDPSNALVTVANGYATGSDGYTGVLDTGDIAGAKIITLKDGVSGTVLDTITLIDVADGATGGDAVYGYIEADGGLAWTQAIDGGAWAPVATTTDLDFTFIQGGADICRDAKRVTRSAAGLLTVTDTAHAGSDLNTATWDVTGSGTQSVTIKGTYSGVSVAETVITSIGGSVGTPGDDAGPTISDMRVFWSSLTTYGNRLSIDISLNSVSTGFEYKVEAGNLTVAPTALTAIENITAQQRYNWDLNNAPTSGTTQTLANAIHLGETRTIWVRARNASVNGSWSRLYIRNDVNVQSVNVSFLPATAATGDKADVQIQVSTSEKNGGIKAEYYVEAITNGDAPTIPPTAPEAAVGPWTQATQVGTVTDQLRTSYSGTTLTRRYFIYRLLGARAESDTAWVTSTAYALGNAVSNLDFSYTCILAHTSASTNEPGVGVNTATYWSLGARSDTAWVTLTAYALGNTVSNLDFSYICILAHTSSSTDEPGVGVNTATYWSVVSSPLTDWAFTEIPYGVAVGVTKSSVRTGANPYTDTITVTLDEIPSGWRVTCNYESGISHVMLTHTLNASAGVFQSGTEDWDFVFPTKTFTGLQDQSTTYRIKVLNENWDTVHSTTITESGA